jgi:hypothetical protein
LPWRRPARWPSCSTPSPALLDAGAYHVELLTKGGDFQVLIYDGENKPLPTKGGKANVTVLHNKKQENFTLSAVEPNLFKGKSPIEAGAGMKVLVAFNLAGKDETEARFKPMD